MSNVPSNDPNAAAPSQLTPNLKTLWTFMRQLLVLLAGTGLGAKYLPPDVLNYLLTSGPQIILAVAGLASLIVGLYNTTRQARIKSTAALPGAVVLLDSQKEADVHATDPGVVGPKDAIPVPAPTK